jgi:hypothetical protein
VCGGWRWSRHPELAFVSSDDLYINDRYIGFPFATPFIAHALIGEDPKTYPAISAAHAGEVSYIAAHTPYAMMFPHVACNLRAHLPHVKLLFILRDPVDALYASYQDSHLPESVSFEEVVTKLTAERDKYWMPDLRRKWSALLTDPDSTALRLERGFYYEQLMNYRNLFPSSQLQVFRYEDFLSRRSDILRQTLGFLGLDLDFEWDETDVQPDPAPIDPTLARATRERLKALYTRTNNKLFELLGWSGEAWP